MTPPAKPVRRIAVLADLHFGTVAPDAIEGLLADLEEAQPHAVAIAGDLTLRAARSEYEAAAGFLARLRVPVLAVPGNHDIPAYNLLHRFTDPFGPWRRYISPQTEPVWHDDQVALLGLNTVRRMALHLDWSAGRVSRPQLDRLAARARQLAGRTLVVVAHHPPRHPPELHRAYPLARGDLAIETFRAAGIAAVVTGHLHRHDAYRDRGVLFVQAGTALSSRLVGGQPNGWTMLTVAGGSVSAAARVLIDGTWQDAPISDRPIPPARGDTVRSGYPVPAMPPGRVSAAE
jgi:3',5'-cyclic AMP phosphodiesterase CpdA